MGKTGDMIIFMFQANLTWFRRKNWRWFWWTVRKWENCDFISPWYYRNKVLIQ